MAETIGCLTGCKAVVARIFFIVHSFLVVWRVTDVLKNDLFWLLGATLILLLFETMYTIIKRNGQEYKWFCPSILFFLMTTVPGIWFLELDRVARYKNPSINGSDHQTEALSAFYGVKIPVQMSADTWVLTLEQSLLFILIIGRWLLPKGNITRDQLSELLFVYIGMASDIMELFVLFEQTEVIADWILVYVILGVWSFSLMQYTLVLTATKSVKTRVISVHPADTTEKGVTDNDDENDEDCCCCSFDTWGVMTTMMMQDGPFLGVRLYVLITYKVINYTILFFTCKNVLILALQVYRLIAVAIERSQERREKERIFLASKAMKQKTKEAMKALSNANAFVNRSYRGVEPTRARKSQSHTPPSERQQSRENPRSWQQTYFHD